MNTKKYNTSVHVKSIVDSILKNVAGRHYMAIFCDWRSVVGDYFNSISAPHKVTASGNKKILVLKAKRGFTLEIQHESDNILHMVHGFLGNTCFSAVKVIQMDS
ncbi:hypothetical protein FACS189449_07460 [Alphaproteobacteria bacterium]|nr:hypothetical protein FACS189449_07460 [Alphaproteobacteria bacterium]